MSGKNGCPSCGGPSADHYPRGHCPFCGLLKLVKGKPPLEELIVALEASYGFEAERGRGRPSIKSASG